MKLLSYLLFTLIILASVFFLTKEKDFQIASTQGEFRLSKQENKLVVLYFGYRFCPDICPTTLNTLSQVYKNLSAEEKSKLKVLFISVDSKRDTLDNLKEYIEFFDQDFIAATGARDLIDSIADDFGFKYSFFNQNGDDENYSVDHSTFTLLIDSKGRIKDTILHEDAFEIIKRKITNNLKGIE